MSAVLIFNVLSSGNNIFAVCAGLESPDYLQVPFIRARFYCVVGPISWLRVPEIGRPFLPVRRNCLHLVRAAHYGQLQLRFAAH